MIEIRATALFEKIKENRGVTSVTIRKQHSESQKEGEIFLRPDEAMWVFRVLMAILETEI